LATPPPSCQPTEDPFPYQTTLTFASELRIIGVDKATFTADTVLSAAVIAAFASVLPRVEAESVTILDAVDVAVRKRRRLRSGVSTVPTVLSTGDYAAKTENRAERSSRALLSLPANDAHSAINAMNRHSVTAGRRDSKAALDSAVQVELQVQIVLEKLGFTASDSDLVYDTLSSAATTAVTSGAYMTALDNTLLNMGSDAYVTVDTTAFTVGSYTMAIAKTPHPSARPTIRPTSVPTINAHSGSRTSDTQTVTIIVIVSTVGTVAILVTLAIGAYYDDQKRLQKVGAEECTATEGSQEMVALVPS
jgi:hypothetical protein